MKTEIVCYLCSFSGAYCNWPITALGRDQKDPMDISTYISITYFLGTGIAFSRKLLWEMMQQF